MASKTVRGADGSAYTLFFTAGSYFSNFYPCDRLHIDGQDFLCSEQFFMYRKAGDFVLLCLFYSSLVTFGDNDSAKKILCATIPGEMKSLGRKVSPFDDKVWKKASLDAMITANVHKVPIST
uniref:DUF1768 domain-containing protein n=1 Tax=Steinernema glaseri TaxID=37863 RepID=A0A1I7Z3W7_9BILA